MTVVHAIVEQVVQRDDLDVFVRDFRAFGDVFGMVGVFWVDDIGAGADGVEERAGAAAAAANEADFYDEVVAAGGMDMRGMEGGECAGAGDGGGFEEIAAGDGGVCCIIGIVHLSVA